MVRDVNFITAQSLAVVRDHTFGWPESKEDARSWWRACRTRSVASAHDHAPFRRSPTHALLSPLALSGPVYEGKGEMQAVIDERADAREAAAHADVPRQPWKQRLLAEPLHQSHPVTLVMVDLTADFPRAKERAVHVRISCASSNGAHQLVKLPGIESLAGRREHLSWRDSSSHDALFRARGR